jgi:alkylation response protein AidB-like acyl-CoA dehydrogenase
MGKLILQDCFLPVENRLGPAGIGAAIFNSSMEWECACILGTQVGAMERQLEELHNYSEQALSPSAASGGGVRGDRVDLYLEKSLPQFGTHPSARVRPKLGAIDEKRDFASCCFAPFVVRTQAP